MRVLHRDFLHAKTVAIRERANFRGIVVGQQRGAGDGFHQRNERVVIDVVVHVEPAASGLAAGGVPTISCAHE